MASQGNSSQGAPSLSQELSALFEEPIIVTQLFLHHYTLLDPDTQTRIDQLCGFDCVEESGKLSLQYDLNMFFRICFILTRHSLDALDAWTRIPRAPGFAAKVILHQDESIDVAASQKLGYVTQTLEIRLRDAGVVLDPPQMLYDDEPLEADFNFGVFLTDPTAANSTMWQCPLDSQQSQASFTSFQAASQASFTSLRSRVGTTRGRSNKGLERSSTHTAIAIPAITRSNTYGPEGQGFMRSESVTTPMVTDIHSDDGTQNGLERTDTVTTVARGVEEGWGQILSQDSIQLRKERQREERRGRDEKRVAPFKFFPEMNFEKGRVNAPVAGQSSWYGAATTSQIVASASYAKSSGSENPDIERWILEQALSASSQGSSSTC